MASVEELCENISLINRSRIVLQGNVAEIRAAHTSDTFHVVTTDFIPGMPDKYEIMDLDNDRMDAFYYTVRKISPAMTNNDLLAALMTEGEILAFEEVLPSMDDIFIETVNGTAPSTPPEEEL